MQGPAEVATRFDRILADYYHAWFRFHPEEAVEAGHDEFATHLTPFGDDDIGALVTLNRELMFSLDELDAEQLDADRLVDYELAWCSAALETESLIEHDWRQRDPEQYLPVNAIYQLLTRPVGDFEAALQARLEQIPDYLRGARRQIEACAERIPPLWLQSAIRTAAEGSRFLREVPNHPRIHDCARAIPNLAGLAVAAGEALARFAGCLESDFATRAAGDFACGERYFGHVLSYRHFLGVDPDQVHALGVSLFEDTASRLRESCMVANGNDDVERFAAKLAERHPPGHELLQTYYEKMEAAKAFVQAHDIVTLPPRERLSVIETPAFFRHEVPFAAYDAPVPGDPEQHAWYYVTPTDDPALLAHHNYPAIQQTCVHEAWPGHHLQFVTANLNPVARSLPRLLNASATFYEGWALYCEQMMLEQGFQDYPEQEFVMLRDRLWRALRIQLDVELHCRGLTVEAAAARMQQALGMSREHALADLTWYTRYPGVPMGYATGWTLINRLRDAVQAEQGDAFTLRAFHDRLLASGSLALPLAIRRGFGDATWAVVERQTFPRRAA